MESVGQDSYGGRENESFKVGDIKKEEEIERRLRELGLWENKRHLESHVASMLDAHIEAQDGLSRTLKNCRRRRGDGKSAIAEIRNIISPQIIRDCYGQKLAYHVNILMGAFTKDIEHEANDNVVIIRGSTASQDDPKRLTKELTIELPSGLNMAALRVAYAAGAVKIRVPYLLERPPKIRSESSDDDERNRLFKFQSVSPLYSLSRSLRLASQNNCSSSDEVQCRGAGSASPDSTASVSQTSISPLNSVDLEAAKTPDDMEYSSAAKCLLSPNPVFENDEHSETERGIYADSAEGDIVFHQEIQDKSLSVVSGATTEDEKPNGVEGRTDTMELINGHFLRAPAEEYSVFSAASEDVPRIGNRYTQQELVSKETGSIIRAIIQENHDSGVLSDSNELSYDEEEEKYAEKELQEDSRKTHQQSLDVTDDRNEIGGKRDSVNNGVNLPNNDFSENWRANLTKRVEGLNSAAASTAAFDAPEPDGVVPFFQSDNRASQRSRESLKNKTSSSDVEIHSSTIASNYNDCHNVGVIVSDETEQEKRAASLQSGRLHLLPVKTAFDESDRGIKPSVVEEIADITVTDDKINNFCKESESRRRDKDSDIQFLPTISSDNETFQISHNHRQDLTDNGRQTTKPQKSVDAVLTPEIRKDNSVKISILKNVSLKHNVKDNFNVNGVDEDRRKINGVHDRNTDLSNIQETLRAQTVARDKPYQSLFFGRGRPGLWTSNTFHVGGEADGSSVLDDLRDNKTMLQPCRLEDVKKVSLEKDFVASVQPEAVTPHQPVMEQQRREKTSLAVVHRNGKTDDESLTSSFDDTGFEEAFDNNKRFLKREHRPENFKTSLTFSKHLTNDVDISPDDVSLNLSIVKDMEEAVLDQNEGKLGVRRKRPGVSLNYLLDSLDETVL